MVIALLRPIILVPFRCLRRATGWLAGLETTGGRSNHVFNLAGAFG
jgi:hypothetical protein